MFTQRTPKLFVLAVIATIAYATISTGLQAGNVTYDFINTPSLQNGDRLSGKITLDATGTISTSDIVSWSVVVTGRSHPFTMSSTDAGASIILNGIGTKADGTHIYLAAPAPSASSQLQFAVGGKNLIFQRTGEQTFDDPDFGLFTIAANDFYGAAAANGVNAWQNSITTYLGNNWNIATAESPSPPSSTNPEPATFLSAVVGGVLAFALWRKRM